MALMLSKTYAAFRRAGVPDDEARDAAEEVANLHNRLTRIEVMIGAILAIQVPILVKLFT